MVTGGESYEGLVYGAYPFVDDKSPDNLSYNLKGGFGFFKYAYLDTHFSNRGR